MNAPTSRVEIFRRGIVHLEHALVPEPGTGDPPLPHRVGALAGAQPGERSPPSLRPRAGDLGRRAGAPSGRGPEPAWLAHQGPKEPGTAVPPGGGPPPDPRAEGRAERGVAPRLRPRRARVDPEARRRGR